LRDLENQNNIYRRDIGDLTKIKEREVKEKIEIQNENSILDKKVKDLESECNIKIQEINGLTKNNDKMSEDLHKLRKDYASLKNHCKLLTRQNQEVIKLIKNLINYQKDD